MKLSPILATIQKYYPELPAHHFEAYCTQADSAEAIKTNQFHFGYNSLKWALESINSINPKEVKNTLLFIIFEHTARNLPPEKLQYSILAYAAMQPYKLQLRQRKTIDIATIPIATIGPYRFAINTTNQNLTSQIFRKTSADAIIFRNPETLAAGYIFRVISSANLLTGFKQYLIHNLQSTEPGWITVGPDSNLIINHGAINNTPTSLTIQQLTDLTLKYPGFK